MGSALLPALRACGLRVTAWKRGQPLQRVGRSDLILLAVSDAAVGPLCAQLAAQGLLHPGQLVAHLAGALTLDALAPALRSGARVGSLHPLRALLRGAGEAQLRGAAAGVAGSDAEAERQLRALARALGLRPIPANGQARALYHAAAVLAAGAQVALFAEAQAAFQAATGASERDARKALLPLAVGALSKLGGLSAAQAITGPSVRGDLATVRAHRSALLAHDPRVLALYDSLTRTATQLARGRAAEAELRKIERLSTPRLAPGDRPAPGSRSSRSPRRQPTAARPAASSRSPARRGRPTGPPPPGPAPRRPR